MPIDINTYGKEILKPQLNTGKLVTIYIPVVMSSTVTSNGLTPYVDYFIEQLFMAYNVSKFAKASKLLSTAGNITRWLVILSTIGYAYTKINNQIKKVTGKEKSKEGIQLVSHTDLLKEDSGFLFDKPREVEIDGVTYRFVCVNLRSTKDVSELIKQSKSITNIILNIIKKAFFTNYSIIADTQFIVSLSSEIDEDLQNVTLAKDKALIIVDTVNNIIHAITYFKGYKSINSIKLSDLKRETKRVPEKVSINDILRQLKSIEVTKL